MTKKIIFWTSIVVLIIVNILIDTNVNNYIKILNKCFNKEITLTNFYYAIISLIIAFITVLLIIDIKLIIFYKKEEIKGIRLKSEDRYISVQQTGLVIVR